MLIKEFEGLVLHPYLDGNGVPTIGYGTTIYPDGTLVTLKDRCITEKEAEEYLEHHVFNEVRIKLPIELVEKVTSKQLEAIESLCYNVGVYSFLKSKLLKAILDDDYSEIYRQWDWFKDGGKVVKGLVKRRAKEMYLFMSEV